MPNKPHDQFSMQNPLTQYPHPPFPAQGQPAPGLTSTCSPSPTTARPPTRVRPPGRAQGADYRRRFGHRPCSCHCLCSRGADIALNYMPIEQPDAREVIKLIEAEGRKVVAIAGDLKDEQFCKALVEQAHEQLGGLDILVNVAGKQEARKDISQITHEQFDHTLKTNVYALFWLCQAAVPLMPAGATIINTASIQSYQPSATLLDYATTKAAIVAFTKALAKQVIERGIRVNAVAPGPIWTVLQPSGGQPPEKIPEFGAQTPMKRPASRPNARRFTSCWPARSPATSPARCSA